MQDIQQTVEVDAPAELVYAMVSDLPRMGEWSPECTRVSWRGGATGPAVGARFVGYNKAGLARWVTMGEVIAAEPGRRFGFDVHLGPIRSAGWEYVVAERPDGGCMLTERFTDHRPRLLRFGVERVLGRQHAVISRGIATTLANLKRAAESERTTS